MLESKEEQETFGEYLQRERNMRGVTLEEISRKINVNKKFLAALENDNYEELPPDVFVRGFLQAYSRCIGLDTNEVILAYSEYTGSHSSNLSGVTDRKIKFVENEKKRSFMFWVLLFGSIIFITVFTIDYYEKVSYKTDTTKDEVEEQTQRDIKDEVLEKTGKEKTPDTLKQDKKNSKVSNKDNTPKAKKSSSPIGSSTAIKTEVSTKEPLSLSIYASENVWIKVKVDEKDSVEALLNIGEQITYKADDQFLLTLGNLKGSIITLNGEELVLSDKIKKNVLRDYKIAREPEPAVEEVKP